MRFSKKPFLLHLFTLLMVVSVSLMLYSCANMARPGGGPKDEEPPVYVKSTPVPGQTNVSPTKIQIEFNENIKLEKTMEKVVVSPPQTTMPIISSNGKKLTVELKDSLIPNTTYTIEFADAVRDNNEGNPLKDFAFSFSTGDHIDSLQISGTLLNAENLEPITGNYVGIQSDLADSAFQTKPFLRIAKTNELGRFTVRNMAPGSYRVYALKDANSNYKFDIPSEDIAYLDSIVTPYVEIKLHADTTHADDEEADSTRMTEVMHFYPDDLVLLSFNENKKNVYLEKTERLTKNKVTFYFSAPEDSLPAIKGLNFDEQDWALVEKSPGNDTVTYWIKDSLVYKLDTLNLIAGYMYTDTLNQLVPKSDTLAIFMKTSKKSEKKEKKNDKNADRAKSDSIEIQYLPVKEEVSSEIGAKPRLIFDEPIAEFNPQGIHLELKKDSVFILQPSQLVQDTLKPREFYLNAKYLPGEEYVMTVDSAAFTGLYGTHNKGLSKTIRFKTVEEYANLLLSVPAVNGAAFVELLDKSDKPVMKAIVKQGQAKFIHVKPGTYFARIVLDTNENGKFDTGNYEEKRQPEEVRYYPGSFELRANWDVKQEWDLYDRPLTQQKPLDITKNKPKEEKKPAGEESQKQNDANSQWGGNSFGGGKVTGTQGPQTFSPNTQR